MVFLAARVLGHAVGIGGIPVGLRTALDVDIGCVVLRQKNLATEKWPGAGGLGCEWSDFRAAP
jgi:hypothetical protein